MKPLSDSINKNGRFSSRVPESSLQYCSSWVVQIGGELNELKCALTSDLAEELMEHVVNLNMMFNGVFLVEFIKFDIEFSESNDLQSPPPGRR